MNLKPFTIKHLVKFIGGDKDGCPYRSGSVLVSFSIVMVFGIHMSSNFLHVGFLQRKN